jgi:indolepyruvate ferredoxin oxidoreductase alpha subunit
LAFELSEAFEIPVMLRPTTRVCHARQDILLKDIQPLERKTDFKKDPERWAATPKFRNHLHKELEKKLEAISAYAKTAPIRLNNEAKARRAIIVAGIAAGHTKDIMKERNLWKVIPLYQVLQPYPLHRDFISHLIDAYDEILVIEETSAVIEMQIADRHRVKGRLTGSVPKVGELLPEIIEQMVCDFADIAYEPVRLPSFSGRRPTLCAGCPHRASFFAIKRAVPHGIYTGDIGCYTLGLNLGVVDTVLCMGASISQAAGFYHACKGQKNPPDIVATIGDSTFFHAGIPALIDAVVQKACFVLVILDNRTTAMTGNQPTPASGISATGRPLEAVDIETVVGGCGIRFCRQVDPYSLNEIQQRKRAGGYYIPPSLSD